MPGLRGGRALLRVAMLTLVLALLGPAAASAVAADAPAPRPAATWRPYATTSPFNVALPARPKLMRGSKAMVARIMRQGSADSIVAIGGSAQSRTQDYSRPIYWSQPTDPVYTIECNLYGGACPVAGQEIRVPDAALAAGGTDGHLTVADAATGQEWSFFRVASKPAGGGTLVVGWGRACSLSGDGTGCGGGAAQFGGLAGRIRYEELMGAVARRGRLSHALFMTVGCTAPGAFVYPATKAEEKEGCANPAGAPEMGRRFFLDMTDREIDALPIPEWRKVIARTMATYGGFVGDLGGVSFGFQFESGMSYLSFGQANPFVTYAQRNPAGIVANGDTYYWRVRDGIPWASRLKALDASVTQSAVARRARAAARA